MILPNSLLQQLNIEQNCQNDYFLHANDAFDKLSDITEEQYFSDYVSILANTIERYYKGFLYAMDQIVPDYHLPTFTDAKGHTQTILEAKGHNLLVFKNEIKNNFTVFPFKNRQDWVEEKQFLRDLHALYTGARYIEYPTFQEFQAILVYAKNEKKLLDEYMNAKRYVADFHIDKDDDLDYS